MARDILLMIADDDGVRQIRANAGGCDITLPHLGSIRISGADLAFLATHLPMVADAVFSATAVPPLFVDEAADSEAACSKPVKTCEEVDEQPSTDEASNVPKPASQAGRKWTVEEEARLRQLLLDGLSIQQVADDLGRSPGSIIARALLRQMIAVNVTPEVSREA